MFLAVGELGWLQGTWMHHCGALRGSVLFEPLERARTAGRDATGADGGFTLINADTDRPIAAFASLTNGAVLNLATLPTKHLNVTANARANVGSVQFALDAKANYRLESGSPFALHNNGADFLSWTPSVGEHVLTATPFAAAQGHGAVGSAITIRFTVVNDARQINVAATPDGPNALLVHWDGLPSYGSAVARYRITAAPGTFFGATRSVEVGASARSATIDGLDSFKMYTVTIRALDCAWRGDRRRPDHADDGAQDTQKRFLYAVSLPTEVRGFRNLTPRIDVFDIANGHKWVRSIPLPAGIFNARGLTVNASTDRLYVSFFNTATQHSQPGGLLAMDLNTDKVLWVKATPRRSSPRPIDSRLRPTARRSTCRRAKAARTLRRGSSSTRRPGIQRGGSTSFPTRTTRSSASTAAGRSSRGRSTRRSRRTCCTRSEWSTRQRTRSSARVGPFRDVVRPFTVTGDSKFMFATLNNFVGFQVANVQTGKVIFTVPVPGVTQPNTTGPETPCHGIAITPDEKLLFIVDRVSGGLQVFDISGVRDGRGAPVPEIHPHAQGRQGSEGQRRPRRARGRRRHARVDLRQLRRPIRLRRVRRGDRHANAPDRHHHEERRRPVRAQYVRS